MQRRLLQQRLQQDWRQLHNSQYLRVFYTNLHVHHLLQLHQLRQFHRLLQLHQLHQIHPIDQLFKLHQLHHRLQWLVS